MNQEEGGKVVLVETMGDYGRITYGKVQPQFLFTFITFLLLSTWNEGSSFGARGTMHNARSVPPFENPYLHDSFLCNVECRQCDSEVRIDTKTHIHITE